jgi:hypothetical protein
MRKTPKITAEINGENILHRAEALLFEPTFLAPYILSMKYLDEKRWSHMK